MHRSSGCLGFLSVVLSGLIGQQIAAQPIADWPQFRGPSGQGTSLARGLPTTWNANQNLAWKTTLPGPGTSSPILVGSKIYLTCYTGYTGQRGADQNNLKLHLVCLDRQNGQELWTKTVAPKLPEQEGIREGHGYASGTPAADAERLYVFFGKTGVVAFDHDGKQLWQTSVGEGLNGWGSSNSPIVHGNLVIINASVESESLVALDKKTGKEVWRASGIRESWNTPVLVQTDKGQTELVVAIMGKVLGFDPATGKELWNCATDIGWYMVPCLVAHDGVVYVIGGRTGGGLAVRAGGRGNVTASHRLWKITKGSNVCSPLYHEGHLYWTHENIGVAYCAEAATGRIVYEERLPGAQQFYASPVLADGKIYHLARNGRTYVLAAKPTFESLAVNDLGAERNVLFNASPAVSSDGKLYIRSDRTLYCLAGK